MGTKFKTAKDLELSLLIKEAHIQQLKLRVKELEKRLNNLRVELKGLYMYEWGDTEDEAEDKINYYELGEENDN